jgi:hypothetical protein
VQHEAAGFSSCFGCEQQAGVSEVLQHFAAGSLCFAINLTVIISPAARTMAINDNLFQRLPDF